MTNPMIEKFVSELSDFYSPDEKLLIATIGFYRATHPKKSRRSLYKELEKKFDKDLIKSTLLKLQASQLVKY